jgi:DNA polymerase-3 subunit alpha
MEEVDELGYLKLDILGLNELDIIKYALGLVEKRHGVKIDFEDFPQGNKKAFQILAEGRTEGVFQMRSNLGRTWCRSIKPTNIEEISAIAALIRPACLDAGMTHRYAKIKDGREEEAYIHDDLRAILGPTLSVYIYQEQALQMCAMVGMTLSEADIVRKAIGKKKPELLAQQEARFVELANQNGYEDIAAQLWNYIKEGAGYGFNKSHSVAYSLLSYKNAYLKANYPSEFFCANMVKCANLGDKQKALDRIKELINDAKITGIKVTPPSIQVCNMDFEITSPNSIAFGLSHIHGVGIGGLRAVSKCKSATDFYDFVRLANDSRVNRRVMEGLIRSGACDMFGMPRKQMELEYTTIQDLPKRERDHVIATMTEEGLLPLIDLMGDEDTVDDRKVRKDFVPNVNRRIKLRELYAQLYEESVFNDDKEWNLQNEQKYLGCTLSGTFEDVFTSLPHTGHNCLDTLTMEDDSRFQLCVQIDDVRVVHTKKDKKPMAFMSVSDKSYGLKDVVVFPKTYAKYGELLVPNSIIRMWCFYSDGVKAWKIQSISMIKSETF